MGYSTYFDGSFELSRKLTVSEQDTLKNLSDWDGDRPDDAPDSTCDWIVDEDQEGNPYVRHNYEEKFRDWDGWVRYLANLFTSWGVTMSGRMTWQGEDTGDVGVIFVKDNRVKFVDISEMPEPNWDEDDEDDEAA